MKFFTHVRDKVGDFGVRAIVHIPIGFFIGLTYPLSGSLHKTFVKYEESEDRHTKDQAWKDYFGEMVGEVAGNIVKIGILIWLLYLFFKWLSGF